MIIILFFIAIEIILRVIYKIPYLEEKLWTQDNLSWHRIWSKKYSKNTYLNRFDDILCVYDSQKGWALKPNLNNKNAFNNKIVNINSQGIRGTNEYLYKKDSNKLRVLIFGDSFTFGTEVSDNETYPYYLQNMLPSNTEIINMGVPGYAQDQMLLYFQEKGLKYKPDIVIIGFLGMDMYRNLLRFRDYAKPRFILKNDKLKLIGQPIPVPEKILKLDWMRPRIFDFIATIIQRYRKITGLTEKEKYLLTTKILNKFNEISSEAEIKLIFVFLPEMNEIFNINCVSKPEEFLFSFCKSKNNIGYLSIRSVLKKRIENGLKFTNLTSHYGPFLNKVIAKSIKIFLIKSGYLTLTN
jgi:hypothetical protein